MANFTYNGTITIEEGLTMENPFMEIMKVDYTLSTNEFSVEVHFWEVLLRSSREFSFVNPNPGSLTMEAVLSFITSHPILSQFTPVA